jgi:hypothetical protein
VVYSSFDEEKTKAVSIRFPADVYRELVAESKENRMLMSEYCRMLIVKRPVKVENVIPDDVRDELATIPELKAKLAEMRQNWILRKKKYADLEADHEKVYGEFKASWKKLEAEYVALKKDNLALTHQRDALKRRLDDVLKQSTKVECPGCGEEIAIDFADEKAVLKQSGSPKH